MHFRKITKTAKMTESRTEFFVKFDKAGPAADIVKIIGGVKVVIYIGSLGGTSISRLMVYNAMCQHMSPFFCDKRQ